MERERLGVDVERERRRRKVLERLRRQRGCGLEGSVVMGKEHRVRTECA